MSELMVTCLGNCGRAQPQYRSGGVLVARWICSECGRKGVSIGDDRDKDIATLRATIERLTAERDELVEMLGEMYDAWENGCPITEGGEPDGAHLGTALDLSEEQEQRILALLKKNGQTHAGPTHAELKSRAESAEATIARLAKVVRAAEQAYEDEHGGYDALASDSMETMREALSSLTAEDRRRAGIEP